MAWPRNRWWLVAFLWVAFALNYLDRQMVYSMFPALRADLRIDAARLGIIGSVFLWVYTLSMPLAGRLADRFPRERMILASLILWSIATLGSGLSHSEAAFAGWRAAMGLTEALYFPAALALLASRYPAAIRSRALGLHQSAQYLGAMLGGWYGGWSADHVGWRQAFAVAGAVGIAYSLVLWQVFRALPPSVEPTLKTGRANWRLLARSPGYVLLCLTFAAFCAMQWVYLAWFPTYLYERYHLSMTDSGWNAAVFLQGSAMLGIFVSAALADRWAARWPKARQYVAGASVLLCAPFAYLTFSSESLLWARVYSALFGLFAGSLAANAFAAACDLIGSEQRGLASGVLNMMGGLSAAAMIYLTGLWKESIGFPTITKWMTVVAMFSAAIWLWRTRVARA
ncbi:MAG: MFS transporter [Bryobacteraceae bacterium]|nr:MFS transporter [Bryobacteraceae bacterium]